MNCEFCIWNCSRLRGRLEYATGGNAERWKEKMFGAAAACRDKHRRSAVRAEAPPCGGSQNSPRWLRHENISCTTIKTENRLRPAQHCKLQKTISEKNDCKQRKPTNCKTAKNRRKKPPDKTNNSLNPPRHYAASGLLNLQTTLMRTMIRTTPGVKLPGAKIKQNLRQTGSTHPQKPTRGKMRPL